MLKKSNDEKCPDGWRIPTADDLLTLSKYQTQLKNAIPFRTYRSNTEYNDFAQRGLKYKSDQGTSRANNTYNYNCGQRGFYAVDMETSYKYKVATMECICRTYVEDWQRKDIQSDLQFPPFYVR